MEAATRTDAAEMMLVEKKSDPRYPSERWNFRLKKFVTHDLDGHFSFSYPEMASVTLTVGQGLMQMNLMQTRWPS